MMQCSAEVLLWVLMRRHLRRRSSEQIRGAVRQDHAVPAHLKSAGRESIVSSWRSHSAGRVETLRLSVDRNNHRRSCDCEQSGALTGDLSSSAIQGRSPSRTIRPTLTL